MVSEATTAAPAISAETRARIDAEITKYPRKRGALLPALHLVQADHGWISTDLANELAGIILSRVIERSGVNVDQGALAPILAGGGGGGARPIAEPDELDLEVVGRQAAAPVQIHRRRKHLRRSVPASVAELCGDAPAQKEAVENRSEQRNRKATKQVAAEPTGLFSRHDESLPQKVRD